MARAWTCVTLTRARLARKRHADATPPVRPIDPANEKGGPYCPPVRCINQGRPEDRRCQSVKKAPVCAGART